MADPRRPKAEDEPGSIGRCSRSSRQLGRQEQQDGMNRGKPKDETVDEGREEGGGVRGTDGEGRRRRRRRSFVLGGQLRIRLRTSDRC